MLIDFVKVKELLQKHGIAIQGVLHIGAHACEEQANYVSALGIKEDNIIWVDGNLSKVFEMNKRGFHVEYAVLDETERETEFNITDYSQASSLLQLNHEEGYYKSIHIIERQMCNTERLSTFMNRIGKDVKQYNFWNLDIQGSELAVLRGSQELLKTCDAIYTEVNRASVYKGCGHVNDIDELLKNYGFTRIETVWMADDWGDALYVKTTST